MTPVERTGGAATCAVILGVPIDDVTLTEAVDLIASMVHEGRRTGRVHQVATVNVDFLVNARRDPSVRRILQRTALSIPDGMPVVWASRLLGAGVRERTTGIDLVPAIVERAAMDGFRVCCFGAAPGVAERAAAQLRDHSPGAEVVGLPAPAVGRDGSMDHSALEPIRRCEPDVVCVALGNPKQEHWIERYGALIGAPVFIGIGGSLDFITGVTRRAPAWMQRFGLEWLHRAASEPRRLVGRYATDLVVFLPALFDQVWRGRRRVQAAATPAVEWAPDRLTVRYTRPAPTAAVDVDIIERLRPGSTVDIDVSGLTSVDSVTVAAIVGLARVAVRRGAHARLSPLPEAARVAADRLGALELLDDLARTPA